MRMINLLGQRFGRLTVISHGGLRRVGKKNHSFWQCRCDCGGSVIVRASHLRSGAIKSCKCLQRENNRVMSLVHGDTRSRTAASEYRAWQNMIERCENPNHVSYKWYGGRGIKVCAQWRDDYQAFLADLGRKPSPQHSLDRIDNDGHYEPGNVRWASAKQQANNRREPHHIAVPTQPVEPPT